MFINNYDRTTAKTLTIDNSREKIMFDDENITGEQCMIVNTQGSSQVFLATTAHQD